MTFPIGWCYSHGSFDTKIGKLIKQDRINFVKKAVTAMSEDFCLNTGDVSIKAHMRNYKDIMCIVPEAKNLGVITVKDIEKVNNIHYYSFSYKLIP